MKEEKKLIIILITEIILVLAISFFIVVNLDLFQPQYAKINVNTNLKNGEIGGFIESNGPHSFSEDVLLIAFAIFLVAIAYGIFKFSQRIKTK